MGRRPTDSKSTRWASMVLLLMGLVSCSVVYIFVSAFVRPAATTTSSKVESLASHEGESEGSGECCKGIDNLELWGAAVKWGADFKFNSSQECCKACRAMCTATNGPCLCDTWVYCGDREACGSKFGECWLKKQQDILAPERHTSVEQIIWTSGIIFGNGQGIVGLETKYGTLRIKLLPECSPNSVTYILELLGLRHCASCQFYRAESRGMSWDSQGNHITDASFGPPFALIQGTLEAQGTAFNKIPTEFRPTIRRGSVAWVGSGPEFFISLANHDEWSQSYTVFGYVLEEDMEIAEEVARLPTKPDRWNNINVSVLEMPVPLRIRRINDP